MRAYESRATINASPEAVWAVLVDGPSYPDWDSGITRVEGTIAEGHKIKVFTELSPKRAFPVKVVDVVPGESMTWRGGMPLGLFKGARTFTLTPRDSARARSSAVRCCHSSDARYPICSRRSIGSPPG